MEKPLVSIVIPVYNGSNYMKEAIDSALNQTYNKCEVIVVNDGSTDDGLTEKIALSYGEKIRYFKKKNGGVATAINFGISKMKGEYFAWLSHDDIFYPYKIEKQIDAIQNSGIKDAICHGNFDFLQMKSGEKTSVDLLNLYERNQLESSCFAPVFLAIHGSTLLIHKSHFERVGNYRTDLLATQDSEFLFRVMRGQKSVFVEQPLIIGRLHEEQGQKTMKCHKPEYNKMFMDFCEELNDEEKEQMCGSVINFYYNLWKLLKTSEPADTIISYLEKKVKTLHQTTDLREVNKKAFISECKEIPYVYIFGAGNYGRNMLKILRDYGIDVKGFLDNDVQKNGKRIDGIKCILPYDTSIDKSTAVIIAVYSGGDDIYNQLNEAGMKRILRYSDINKLFFKIYPVNNRLVGEENGVDK